MIAEELEMPTLLVPAVASVLCATGMLLTDLKHDFVRTYITRFSKLDPARLQRLVEEMSAEGEAQLAAEGLDASRVEHEIALDLRYVKQYHEVTLPVPRAAVAGADLTQIARAFHAEHDRLYGYQLADGGTDLELINVRVRSIGRTDKPAFAKRKAGGRDPGAALKKRRRAWVPERGAFEEVPVYDGHALLAGNVVEGPALVERADTTIFVSASFVATIDESGGALLERRPRKGAN
jgi:N-methylhydantoinase A